jgi:CheY-like chemotaxis protein
LPRSQEREHAVAVWRGTLSMRRKVIVVEDDAAFSYAVGKTLEQAGYEVEIHADPTAAWTAVGATAHFDLLLTDLMFPHGQPSGIALARSARYHHSEVAIIYMTAYPDAAEQAEMEDGIVLAKPIDLNELIQRVGELVGADQTRKN